MTSEEAKRMLMVVATATNDLPHGDWLSVRLGECSAAYDLIVAAGGAEGSADSRGADGRLRRLKWATVKLGPVEFIAHAPPVALRVVEEVA